MSVYPMTAAWSQTALNMLVLLTRSPIMSNTLPVSLKPGHWINFTYVCLDCSRYWECGPAGETCLWDCAPCQHAIGENELCAGSWALYFDVQYQYPVGPVCDWPSNVDCSNND